MDREKKYIDPVEFAQQFDIWKAKGKPQGNDTTYLYIWQTVVEAVKANIGKLQKTYSCRYSDYDGKVVDGTCAVMKKLLQMDDTPKSIISLSYLYVLGVCCGRKAQQQDWESNNLSYDEVITEHAREREDI